MAASVAQSCQAKPACIMSMAVYGEGIKGLVH